MIERHLCVKVLTWLCIIMGIVLMIFPVWIAFVSSTYTTDELLSGPRFLLGNHFLSNYKEALFSGVPGLKKPFILVLLNSFIMAITIAVAKVILSLLSAYAFVFFNFKGKSIIFWSIFITLMLPIEVRILPTFQVVSSLHLLNSFPGLIFPLIASATATFLFRQFFMSLPYELVEAAKVDGATPMRFFFDILLPLSKTNIVAIFVCMFLYGWNQYLWPLVVTITGNSMPTAVMSIHALLHVTEPMWQYVMTLAILAMIPPIFVIIVMQKAFVKGLVDTEK